MKEYYWYWLCNIKGIGRAKIKKLLSIFSSPKEIYDCSERVLSDTGVLSNKDIDSLIASKRDNNIYKDFISLSKKGIEFVHINSKDYPERLKDIPDNPICLYVKGKLPDNDIPAVSIVGARNCTEYGKAVSYELANEFAKMGVQIISGMALGVDSQAHKGCLDGNGFTCAVLGCGVNICYPRENIEIYETMSLRGGIISEYALDTKPFPGQFPERNRIISGLSDIVIVTEARIRSGSLITVDQALEQNRDVMVVPGRIYDKLSDGCNNLIKLGASIITKPEDILDNTKVSNLLEKCANNRAKSDTEKSILENTILVKTEKVLYSCLNLYPKSVDTLVKETGLSLQETLNCLFNLQISGFVKEVSKNSFVRVQMHI